jgi:hypothetical protein
MVARNAYSRERLAHLLGLLRPAPEVWVTRAQSTILELLAPGRTAVDESPLTETQVAELARALERDPAFRESFDADPVAAADAAGWSELARGLKRELRGLVALAERIAADEVFRADLHSDPVRVLVEAGIPSPSVDPLLHALEGSDAASKVPDVVAHVHEQPGLRTRLVNLLLGSSSLVERIGEIAGLRPAGADD